MLNSYTPAMLYHLWENHKTSLWQNAAVVDTVHTVVVMPVESTPFPLAKIDHSLSLEPICF
jgi:hypothetical protein